MRSVLAALGAPIHASLWIQQMASTRLSLKFSPQSGYVSSSLTQAPALQQFELAEAVAQNLLLCPSDFATSMTAERVSKHRLSLQATQAMACFVLLQGSIVIDCKT